eukprot:484664-Amphidinium_carterae.1
MHTSSRLCRRASGALLYLYGFQPPERLLQPPERFFTISCNEGEAEERRCSDLWILAKSTLWAESSDDGVRWIQIQDWKSMDFTWRRFHLHQESVE